MAEEDNLDALCDLLEDSDDEKDETIGSQLDDSFDEQIFNLNDKEVAKIEAVKKPDNNSNSKKKNQNNIKGTFGSPIFLFCTSQFKTCGHPCGI